MDREQIEIRYLELLNAGQDPMDDASIRRAVEADAALGDELLAMGRMIDALGDASRPEGADAMPDRDPIDAITTAFEEGYQQGRRAAVERPARHGASAWFPTIAVAAALVAFAAGIVWQRSESSSQLAAVETDVRQLRQTVAVSLLENESPAQRIRGLEWAAGVDEPSDELVAAMSNTLRADKSVTVRLATAEALNRYGSLPKVRRTIIDTMLGERDPLVQLQLIDLLINVRDAETIQALRALMDNPQTDDLVRQRASWALKETS